MYISVNHVCDLEDDKGLSHTNDKTRQMFAVVAVIDDVVAVVVVFVAADDDVVVVVTAASACISRPHYSFEYSFNSRLVLIRKTVEEHVRN